LVTVHVPKKTPPMMGRLSVAWGGRSEAEMAAGKATASSVANARVLAMLRERRIM
jgi:hypothetical protein